MTKEREIEILSYAAKRLGNDSYCGRWLAEQIPLIEADIRGDCYPGLCASTWRDMQDNSRAVLASSNEGAKHALQRADEQCSRMLAIAGKESERIVKEAEQRAATHTRHVMEALRKVRYAIADLEGTL